MEIHQNGRTFCVLPLRICEAYQNYYLICYMKNTNFLSHYRIDLITNLEIIQIETEENAIQK